MHCITVLLLASCLAFSSARLAVKHHQESADVAKRHHEPGHNGPDHNGPGHNGPGHNGPGHNGPGHHGPGGDDDSDESDEVAEEQCEDLLLPCFVELYPYLSADRTAEIMNQSIRAQCESALSIRDCFRTALESRACTTQFDEDDQQVLRLLSFIGGIIKFVCEDKLTEFETHEQCFRDARVDQDVEECREENFQGTQCKAEQFIACSTRIIGNTPTCEAGAEELVTEFVRLIMSYVPDCQVPGMKLMKKLRMKRRLKMHKFF